MQPDSRTIMQQSASQTNPVSGPRFNALTATARNIANQSVAPSGAIKTGYTDEENEEAETPEHEAAESPEYEKYEHESMLDRARKLLKSQNASQQSAK